LHRTNLAAFILWPMAIFVILATPGCAEDKRVTLNVSAGAGLIDAVTEINELYMQQNSNVNILSTFSAAGDLQVQIENGAPADIFFSPSSKHMDALADQNLIVQESRRNIVKNSLVLITPAENKLNLSRFIDLLDENVQKVAMGDPEFVPAGAYGLQTLEAMEISFSEIETKLILANNVRQVLNYVENRSVDAGIVYATDALSSESVKVIAVAPDSVNENIVFPAAVITTSSNVMEASNYLDYLSGTEAGKVFEKYGYTVINK
jgi:molybdate transport system substrate-binding protein